MISIEIPGRPGIKLQHLVLDYNGTIAVDGKLAAGLRPALEELSRQVVIHVLTADTYGTVRRQCEGLPLSVHTFPRDDAGQCKAEIVSGLTGGVCCMGNGFNDIPMFDLADLSVAILMDEGICAGLLPHADILVPSVTAGLDLLLKPQRIRATLRS